KELEDLRAKETQKAWLEAFGLKSLEEAYIPNFKAEVKEAINRVLGGEEIKLTKGSLIKLIKEKRLKYLDRIKPTLENPHSVILQNDGALIFARDYGEEKYFTSVARNDSGEWIIRSNAPKSKNGLNNKILNGGKEIYNDQAASQINASNPYDDIANSNIKLDNESIAQNGIKDNKQAFLQFIKIMQDTKNGDFYPSENLQNALEKSGKKARENALELFIKEYESKDAKLVELLKNIQEPRIASKALSLIKHFTQARMMQSAIKAVPSDILMKYVNIDASQRLEVLSSLYGDFSNIMKEVALKGKKIPDPAALSEKGGAYVFNRQYRKILNIYEKIQENEELLRLLAHKNDYKTTIEIIQESKAKGLSVKQTKEAIEENKKQTAKLFDEVIRQENKPSVKPLDEFGINFEGFKGKEAIEKLLEEQRGQVKGAFYKEGLGEIDLVWGEAGSGKSDGFGLAKIVKYHPEVIDKLDDIIANTSIVKESDNRYHLENENYKLAIRKDFEGEKTNWLLTAFEKKDSIARRRTDLPSTQSEAEKTTSANANEIIPQEIEQAEIKKLLEEYGEQISSNYPQETARLILEQNKNDGIVLSGFKIKGKSYDSEIEAMQFKTKKAEREFESLMASYDIKGDFLNFKEAYSFKPNDEAFLQYLAKYEGDENAKLALAYNLAKQLVMRRGGGRAEVYTTDFLRQMHILENQNSTTLHSNPHLGAGLVGGVLNGVEQDENGNLSFDPVKFAMGFLGGSGGSFALKKGFQILEKNPELKEKIINELADTLAQGFEKAREKYSLLNLLEPRYIVKNEKGRKIQAKTMLKELEREQKGLYNVAFNGKNAVLIKKDLEAVDEAILFEKGTKRKGGKHIRLAHSTEPSQEGYVTKQEVANLGVNIREYLKNYEPFIDKNGARLYEWKDENGVKFRAVVNNTQTSGGNSHLPSASEEIITFYSDRNLKEKMNFKNPLLKDTIAESTMQGEALSKELESKEANTHTLRGRQKSF
ncbi:hypothetical protein WGZ40_001700, partial [Campylobacter upsaliensis]